jgi:hypothetical protein
MNDITGDRSGDKSGDTTNRSGFRRLETDTLVKTLFDAIEYEWSDNALRVIIKELSRKGYDKKKLLHMVEDKFGKPAALKIIRILYS